LLFIGKFWYIEPFAGGMNMICEVGLCGPLRQGGVMTQVRTQRIESSTLRRCFSFIFWALGKI